jgi:hypothetical protein
MAEKQLFPCCVCGQGLEVRQTKKGKPYVICDPCGMQMFVRVTSGIQRFEGLVKDAARKDLWKRLDELQERYKKKCPKCSKRFWVSEELIETSMFDGSFVGYRCPEKGCKGVVKAGESR